MKFAVSSYSYSGLIRKGEMTQLDTISKAKEMGFDGIELVDIAKFTDGDLLKYAETLRKEAEKNNIEVANVCFGADFVNNDFDEEVERVKLQIDAAAETGAKSVRHDVIYSLPKGKAFENILPVIAEGCRRVSEYAQTKGVATMVENHGFICQDSDRVEKLYVAVNHGNFGLITDIGNFLCADENPVTAVSRVAPFARLVHAKDFIVKSGSQPDPGKGFFKTRGANYLRGTIIGHGDVPVKQCLDVLKKTGFDGWVSLEFEGIEDVIFAIETGFENLKKYAE
ncbi:MAG: sugar phosphate isomerase/epimerase [Clostridia bacterium]|nr:sugar phosphate isomerase/epimerase [Clostridia bacterium]